MDDLFSFEVCTPKYKPVAQKLIEKFDELRHVDPQSLLFVMNKKGSGKHNKKVILAKTSKVPPKWQEIMFQLGSPSYFYLIEFFEKSVAVLDENQMTALIYRELRRIDLNGNIGNPDIHEWYQIFVGLGRHWFYPDATCPDLLAEEVDWHNLMGSYYEQPLPSE